MVQKVSFTNNSWSFVKQGIKTRFYLSSLTVINDFTAQALVPPYLSQQALTVVRDGTYPNTPVLVLGAEPALALHNASACE